MFISLKATFLEKKFLGEGTIAYKVELDEVQQVERPTPTAKPELNLIRSDPKPNVPVPLRRSDRVSCQSDRYYDFLIRDGDPIELDENDENLITYIDAMQRSDSEKWLEAMQSKMESMKVNDVWTLALALVPWALGTPPGSQKYSIRFS